MVKKKKAKNARLAILKVASPANKNRTQTAFYFTPPFKETKNKDFKTYEEKENEKIAGIYRSLEESKVTHLDFQTLYPELQLTNKVVGIFDPHSLTLQKLPDLFPFFEVILCRIYLGSYSGDKRFEESYGCTYKSFLQLVDMGKIVPLIDDTPYLDNSSYNYFKSLLQKAPPSSSRSAQILKNDYIKLGVEDPGIAKFHTDARILLLNIVNTLNKDLKLKDLFIWDIFFLAQKAAQRGDIALAYMYINYFYESIQNKKLEPKMVTSGLREIDRWHEQPFLAAGVTLNYSNEIGNYIKNEAGKKHLYLEAFLTMFPKTDEEAINKFIMFVDALPSLSGESLAVLKKSYFYESPEFYDDPVKYAYALSKSTNIKENYKIAKHFTGEIESGRFKNVQEMIEKNDFDQLISEINHEIQSIQRTSRIIKIMLEFGASIVGATTGALLGQPLEQSQFSLVFSFLGANAASAIMKDYSKSISAHYLTPIFRRSNTALLLWKNMGQHEKGKS